MTDAPTEENALKTIADLEKRVQESGAWGGISAPEFTADGEKWVQVWIPKTPPIAGRVRVFRKGSEHANETVRSWDDLFPEDPDWQHLWTTRPMPLFGSALKRDGIRHTYRDIVGDYRGPDEAAPDEAPEPAEADIDWDAAIANAPDVAQLDTVWADMRDARARTGAREKAYKDRRAELIAAAWTPGPVIDPAIELSDAERAEHLRFFPEDAVPEPVPARRGDTPPWARPPLPPKAPQDYKAPQNRAARRAGKKGRR